MEQEIIHERSADAYEEAMLQILRLALRMRMKNLAADPFSYTGAQIEFVSFSVKSATDEDVGCFEHFRSKWKAFWSKNIDSRVTVNFHLEYEQVLEIMQDCLRAIDTEPVHIS